MPFIMWILILCVNLLKIFYVILLKFVKIKLYNISYNHYNKRYQHIFNKIRVIKN